jgi:hypothetical protein
VEQQLVQWIAVPVFVVYRSQILVRLPVVVVHADQL